MKFVSTNLNVFKQNLHRIP